MIVYKRSINAQSLTSVTLGASRVMGKGTFWVVLDDTDPAISYVGDSWFPQSEITSTYTRNDSGGLLNSNGKLWKETVHGTKAPSSMSVSYSGKLI